MKRMAVTFVTYILGALILSMDCGETPTGSSTHITRVSFWSSLCWGNALLRLTAAVGVWGPALPTACLSAAAHLPPVEVAAGTS